MLFGTFYMRSSTVSLISLSVSAFESVQIPARESENGENTKTRSLGTTGISPFLMLTALMPRRLQRLSRCTQSCQNETSSDAWKRARICSLTGRRRSMSAPMLWSWTASSTAPCEWLRLKQTSGYAAKYGFPCAPREISGSFSQPQRSCSARRSSAYAQSVSAVCAERSDRTLRSDGRKCASAAVSASSSARSSLTAYSRIFTPSAPFAQHFLRKL